MSYLKYSPLPEERKELGKVFWEIWQGLPNLHFEEAESRGGSTGLRYEDTDKKTYVWVDPDGYSAYKANPDSVFYAMMRSRDSKSFEAASVMPSERTLEDAITHAAELNQKILEDRRKDAEKKARKARGQK